MPALIEMKLAAGRLKDENDVVELVRANQNQVDSIRNHLLAVHPDDAATFDRLVVEACEDQSR